MLLDIFAPQWFDPEKHDLRSILPEEVPILPLRNIVALPMAVIPLSWAFPVPSS